MKAITDEQMEVLLDRIVDNKINSALFLLEHLPELPEQSVQGECVCDRVSTESGTSCATQRIWMEGRISELEAKLEARERGLYKLGTAIRMAERKHREACHNGTTGLQVWASMEVDNLKAAFAYVTNTAVGGMHYESLLEKYTTEQGEV